MLLPTTDFFMFMPKGNSQSWWNLPDLLKHYQLIKVPRSRSALAYYDKDKRLYVRYGNSLMVYDIAARNIMIS